MKVKLCVEILSRVAAKFASTVILFSFKLQKQLIFWSYNVCVYIYIFKKLNWADMTDMTSVYLNPDAMSLGL